MKPASKSPSLPDKKIGKSPHWRDAAKTVSQVAEAHRGKAAVGGGEIAERKTNMRFVSMALALAIMTGSALAQETRDMGSMKGEGKGRHATQNSEQQKIEREKKKAADDAYKAALKGIPDSKIKDDPWRGVR